MGHAASTTRVRQALAQELRVGPGGLRSGVPAAPVVARLVAELAALGVEGLERPRCLDCGEPRALVSVVEGGRVCRRCHGRRRVPEPCVRCGHRTRTDLRDGDGGRICQTCRRQEPGLPRRCGRCGTLGEAVAHEDGVIVGRCGLDAAARAAGQEVLCAHCVGGRSQPCLAAARRRSGGTAPDGRAAASAMSGRAAAAGAAATCGWWCAARATGNPISAVSAGRDRRCSVRVADGWRPAVASGAGPCCAARAPPSPHVSARAAGGRAGRRRTGPRGRSAPTATSARCVPRPAVPVAGGRGGRRSKNPGSNSSCAPSRIGSCCAVTATGAGNQISATRSSAGRRPS